MNRSLTHINDPTRASFKMDPFTKIYLFFRPEHPEAKVFDFDLGLPDSANIQMIADTPEGDLTLLVCRSEWYRAAKETGFC